MTMAKLQVVTKPATKAANTRLQLRETLWPGIEAQLWHRTKEDGWSTESSKAKGIEFPEALQEVNRRTGRVEASFASKLVATLDPSKPVIDKFVLAHFELRLPRCGVSNQGLKTIHLYRELCDKYHAFLQGLTGGMIRKLFDERYPWSEVSELKKLELVLWQVRA
jgi:hypothetical protein